MRMTVRVRHSNLRAISELESHKQSPYSRHVVDVRECAGEWGEVDELTFEGCPQKKVL